MSEKLCVQWNDFKENVFTSFSSLRGGNDFTDVTLACEDGQQVEAHKVILATSSPFFDNLLKRNNSFLVIAEELHLKGLMGSKTENETYISLIQYNVFL